MIRRRHERPWDIQITCKICWGFIQQHINPAMRMSILLEALICSTWITFACILEGTFPWFREEGSVRTRLQTSLTQEWRKTTNSEQAPSNNARGRFCQRINILKFASFWQLLVKCRAALPAVAAFCYRGAVPCWIVHSPLFLASILSLSIFTWPQ